MIGVNLGGTWPCSRAVVPGMKESGEGKIVNISSACYPFGLVPYIAAKGGIVGLTRSLARELGSFGIAVNAVASGYTPVKTDGSVHVGEKAVAFTRQMVEVMLTKYTETPEDPVGTVVFLISTDSDFVTGQMINVDGGWARNWGRRPPGRNDGRSVVGD